MRLLNGVVSTLTSTVSTIIQRLRDRILPGASNTFAQITTGKTKSRDAQEQLQPVRQKRKQDKSVAQSTTVASLQKQTQNPVLAVLGQGGLQREIRASKTPLPVKPAVKAKAVRVPSIKAALLSQQEQAPAQTPTVAQSGEPGKRKTVVSKTRQVAPKVSTTKRKAVASTTPAKKRTKKQTPAQTPTGRKSKVRGS